MSRKGSKVFGKMMKMVETQKAQLEKLEELLSKYTGDEDAGSGSGSGSSGSDGKKRKTSKWAYWVKMAKTLFPEDYEAFDKTPRGFIISFATEMRKKHAEEYDSFIPPEDGEESGEAAAAPAEEKPKKAKKAKKAEESESEAEKPKKAKKAPKKAEESETETEEKPKKTTKRVAKKTASTPVKEVFGSDSEDE